MNKQTIKEAENIGLELINKLNEFNEKVKNKEIKIYFVENENN